MNRFTWLRNPLVKFDDKNLRLVPPNPAGKWCLIAADETTEFSPVELSEGELAVLYIERRLSFRLPGGYDPTLLKRERLGPTIDDLPEAQKKEAIRRNSYVKGLQDAGCKSCSPSAITKLLIEEVARELGDPCPPHPISVYRWARRSAQSGRGVLSLRRKSWGTNTGRDHRMSERTVEIIDQCIDNIYLEGRESGEATRLEVMRIIANENLSLPPTKQLVAPSLATIYRMINGRDAYERAVARYGEDEANRRFRHSKAGFRATRPNERVEVDHTPLDLFVVDEHSHLPLGRPWCVFRPIVTAHSEKGVTGDSEVVTGDSDLIVTDSVRRRNHRSRCRNRRSRSNRNGLCGQRGNHPCHGYPRALCAERRDAGGADCHAQHQGAVTAQVRLRALA